MHIHILGICGTFMGGIAALAKQAGHRVTGCDANVYPPMSFVGWVTCDPRVTVVKFVPTAWVSKLPTLQTLNLLH